MFRSIVQVLAKKRKGKGEIYTIISPVQGIEFDL